MRGLVAIVGVIVIIVLLVSSGVMSGAVCLNKVGCVFSDGHGISVDSRQSVTISTGTSATTPPITSPGSP